MTKTDKILREGEAERDRVENLFSEAEEEDFGRLVLKLYKRIRDNFLLFRDKC